VKIRYQADNDLDFTIVTATRRLDAEIDFQSAVAAGLHEGVLDPEVLARAAHEGRILVTHDKRTMPDHFEHFISQRDSPGVLIVSRRMALSQAAEWLHLMWAASDAEEYVNSIRFLR
jgi:hypothetical protein